MESPRQSQASSAILLLRVLLPLVYLGILVVPAYIFFSVRGGTGFLSGLDLQAFSYRIFPIFGLYAFTLVWFQFMLGSSMGPLRRVFPGIKTFHQWEGAFALLFALTHASLLPIGVGLHHYLARDFVAPRLVPFIWVGYVQLTILIITAGTALLRKIPWLQPRWHYIHFANYLLFALVWVHSWFLGSDVQTTNLRYLWLFFAITALASGSGRLVRKLRKRSASSSGSGSFVRVATASAVPEGSSLCVTAGATPVALFKVGGSFYALANHCPHEGGPLCEGQLVGTTIICPWHRSRFDVTSGARLAGPATRSAVTYPVRITDGGIWVAVPA